VKKVILFVILLLLYTIITDSGAALSRAVDFMFKTNLGEKLVNFPIWSHGQPSGS
jgi:hypothetical protein